MAESRNYYYLLVPILLFSIFFVYVQFLIGVTEPSEDGKETIVVLKGVGNPSDLMQTNQGTVIVTFSAKEQDVIVGDTIPTKVLLFDSNKIQGLSILYLYDEKIIEAGMPKLSSNPVTILDGSTHQIAYTFKEGDKQILYYDGQMISESEYQPRSSMITGMVVSDLEISSEVHNGDVQVFSEALTPEEILALR